MSATSYLMSAKIETQGFVPESLTGCCANTRVLNNCVRLCVMAFQNSYFNLLNYRKSHFFNGNPTVTVVDFEFHCSHFIWCEDVLVELCFERRCSLRTTTQSFYFAGLLDLFIFIECNSLLSDDELHFVLHVVWLIIAEQFRPHQVLNPDFRVFYCFSYPN